MIVSVGKKKIKIYKIPIEIKGVQEKKQFIAKQNIKLTDETCNHCLTAI
jgi:hypothetical protein